MKERILFECIGQGGGNIGQQLFKRGYVCHFINASNTDLESIEVPDNLKYHIPNSFGSNKDRTRAMKYLREYNEHIFNVIEGKFPRQDIVFFVFTSGGGTGSGISPLLIDYIASQNPSKHYGAIVVLPHLREGIVPLNNSLECLKQLRMVDNIKSVFVLDNNTRNNVFEINLEFACLFDELMDITKADKRGVIDGAELEKLITTKGMSIMGHLNFDYDNAYIKDSVFAPYRQGCEYMGVSLAEENINLELLDKNFGIPTAKFLGYNNESNFAIISGMQIFSDRLNEMSNRVKQLVNDRNFNVDEPTIDIPIKRTVEEKIEKKKMSFDDVFGKFMK